MVIPGHRAFSRDLGSVDLLVIRAALTSGASPTQALLAVGPGPLHGLQTALRLRTDLPTACKDVGPLPAAASSLVQTLAMADLAGVPGTAAVDLVLHQVSTAARLADLVVTRSAQAVLSARLLVGLPVAATVVLAMVDPAARAIMTSGAGIAVLGMGVVLIAAAALWMRLLLRRIPRAGRAADPLIAAGLDAAPGGHTTSRDPGLPTVQIAGLLAMALRAGTPLSPACRMVARLLDGWVAGVVEDMADGLDAGLDPRGALPVALAELATLIDVTQRFGAPLAHALEVLAADIRDRSEAATERAAERITVQLVLPTTLLLVPAFALLVVTPLVGSALAGVT